MMLKERVAMLLKARGRTLFWLAEEMGKNVDGLRLLIQRGTLNYNDIIVMAEVLGVRPGVLFGEIVTGKVDEHDGIASACEKQASRNDHEIIRLLKNQLRDLGERIEDAFEK